MTQVLLIEDDLENCEILSMYLMKSQRYQVSIAHSAEETMALLKRRTFDLVLLDIMLPDMNGVDLCVELRRKMFCPIIFISCLDDEETIVRAIHLGGDDYLTKPFRAPVLLAHMDAVRAAERGKGRGYPDRRFSSFRQKSHAGKERRKRLPLAYGI